MYLNYMKKILFTLSICIVIISCSRDNFKVKSTEINLHPVRVVTKNSSYSSRSTDTIPFFKEKNTSSGEHLCALGDSVNLRICENSLVSNQAYKPTKQRALPSNYLSKNKESSIRSSQFNPDKVAFSSNDKPIHWAATLSLVMGILGFVLLPILGSIAAIVFGIVALNKINAENSNYSGKGMAIAGLALGILSLMIFSLFIAIILSSL